MIDIPIELQLYILNYLDLKDILVCKQVSPPSDSIALRDVQDVSRLANTSQLSLSTTPHCDTSFNLGLTV